MIGYGSLGALVFSLYIVYDTQLMMGGKHKYSLSPEEYIFAALNLYLDVVNLFRYVLILVGIGGGGGDWFWEYSDIQNSRKNWHCSQYMTTLLKNQNMYADLHINHYLSLTHKKYFQQYRTYLSIHLSRHWNTSLRVKFYSTGGNIHETFYKKRPSSQLLSVPGTWFYRKAYQKQCIVWSRSGYTRTLEDAEKNQK